ncbi:uncharacterized protein LOC142625206 [Castanea sativa]|uniref:uncharacterized protein LOC142625206 n=1 Tax=Castanea sativa TaxID=21020 RepID=UPI003F650E1F
MDLLKYLFEKLALSGRLSRWLILLVEFDLKYVARKIIKGSVMSDFCTKNPIKGEDCKENFPNEDIFDVELGNGIGILLITLEGFHIPLTIKLNFKATNNMTEYVVKEKHLKPYQQYLEDLTKTFDKIEYAIIPRAQNQFMDALAGLATLAFLVEIPEGVWTQPLEIEQSYEEVHKGKTKALVMTIEEKEVPWYYDIMRFLELGAYVDGADKREHRSIRMMATQYILCGEQLYRRSYNGIHLHCLKKKEAEMVMEEIH